MPAALRLCKEWVLAAAGEREETGVAAGAFMENVAHVGDVVLLPGAAAVVPAVVAIVVEAGIGNGLVVRVAPRATPTGVGRRARARAAPLRHRVRPPAALGAVLQAGHVVARRTAHRTVPLALPGLGPPVLVIVVVVGGVLVGPAAGPGLGIEPPVVLPLAVVEGVGRARGRGRAQIPPRGIALTPLFRGRCP